MTRLALPAVLLVLGVPWCAAFPARERAAARHAPPRVSATAPRGDTVETRFPEPAGFRRRPTAAGSFAAYLRALPLRPEGTPVRLHDGRPKRRQDVHAAVVDLDVGDRDLQQCADTVMRLRAEHLFAAGRTDEIAFHFTSGFLCPFARWAAGERPRVEGAEVAWRDGGARDGSRAALRRYLDVVFAYAGTQSLPRDLVRAPRATPVRAGDVFLHPGAPGHAAIVADVAERGDARAFLLVQGYMPAQDAHVLWNAARPEAAAWFLQDDGAALTTPEWTFGWDERWSWPERDGDDPP